MRVTMVGTRNPRSNIETYVRSIPESSAKSSCDKATLNRACRKMTPKTLAALTRLKISTERESSQCRLQSTDYGTIRPNMNIPQFLNRPYFL